MPTYQKIVDEARVLLQDTEEDFRYSDTVLVGILNRALHELGRLRSDAFFDLYDKNTLNVPTLVTGTAESTGEVELGNDFPLDGMFYPPIVEFIVGMAELTDDEFTVEGRAATLLQKFRNDVVAV